MSLDVLYREVVMDHQRRPRGRHELAQVHARGHGKNPSCGDEVTIQLQLDGDRVIDVGVHGHGCAISTASGSILAEQLVGLSLAESRDLIEVMVAMLHGDEPDPSLDLGDLEALGGVRQFPVRIKCALLPWMTLRDAIDDQQHDHVAQDDPRVVSTGSAGAAEGTR
jgi:nitrogen fixation NifU-like protein